MYTQARRCGHVSCAETPVVQRGADEDTVTAGTGKPLDILESTNTATGKEHRLWNSLAYAND